jgi:E3 ubiquitin-protein ligase makorin
MSSRQPCRFFNTASGCRYASLCRFSHTISGPSTIRSNKAASTSTSSTSREVCRFFAAGHCNRGDQCWYSHENPLKLSANSPKVAPSPVPPKEPVNANHNIEEGNDCQSSKEKDAVKRGEPDICCICQEKPVVYGLLRE